MIFETHTINKDLSPYIESIFHFKGFTPDHSIERVVPTGHVFLIMELDGMPRNTFDNETLKPNATFTNVWVSGMHKNYLSISAHQDSEMFVMQFKPYGAYPFFQQPIEALNDRVVAAEEVLGDDVLALRNRILTQSTSAEKFELAEDWLKGRMNPKTLPPEELITAVRGFLSQPFDNHAAIVEAYPKTQKHLISQMKKYAGLTPKVFHRIMRFNEILLQIKQKNDIAWSQIAYQFGYADQSHFIKEFREFSGFNPQNFINLELNKREANFFPLD